MKYLNRLILVLVSLLFLVDLVHAETAGDLNTQGRASFVSRDGNNLYLGTEGDDDVIIVQNNVTTFSIDGATGAITFSGTLTPELPNNTYLTAKNAAGSADIDVLKVDATDDTILNADTGNSIKLAVAGTSIITVGGTGLLPATDGNNTTSNLGSSVQGFKNIYLSDATNRSQLLQSNGLYVSYPSGQGIFFREASTDRWSIAATTGTFTSNATNGGGIILPRGITTPVLSGLTSYSADMTSNFAGNNFAGFVTGNLDVSQVLIKGVANTGGTILALAKSRATDGSADTIVSSGDELGNIEFYGADGVNFRRAARIRAIVDSIPGASDMPGGLVFQVTPDGDITPANALYIDNSKAALFYDKITSSRTTDLGWSAVNAPNQACNTTCTSACVFGMNTGALGNFVGCADATADTCICAGSS